MPNETILSRRGLFAKIGILFDAFVGLALAVPIVQFLLSSISRRSSKSDGSAAAPGFRNLCSGCEKRGAVERR